MCWTIKINGVRYTHAQARLLFERMSDEIEKLDNEAEELTNDLKDARAREGIARRELGKVMKERDQLREKLSAYDRKRGTDGRFSK